MKLVPWFRRPVNMATWRDEFDTFFDNFFNIDDFKLMFIQDWSPRIDISETESEYHFWADLPGMSKKSISIVVKDGVLTIEGERQEKKEQKERKYTLIERKSGKFKRSFVLPVDVREEDVKASYRNGVLEVILPRVEKPGPRDIEINGRQ